jgi:cytochrome c5
MRSLLLLSASIACLFACLLAAAQNRSQPLQRKAVSGRSGTAEEIREGERIFHENCSRCHYPPEDLSPREVRAVVRQMRVRAILSEKDEQRLLEFLAP